MNEQRLLAPLELARQQLNEKPSIFDELEYERDVCRQQGRYKEAGIAQAGLEQAKAEEESRKIRELNKRHQQELAELEEASTDEYNRFAKTWEERLAALSTNISNQRTSLQLKHQNVQDEMARTFSAEIVKPKWSRDLLNMRVQEEHLIKQRNFPVAHKLKASADQMEEREYKAAAAAQLNRQNMEYSKLQSRQMRDAEALQRKLQILYDEHVLTQERELEKLMKRTAAARNAMLRNQGNKMVLLEQALKGWFNPKKIGLPPPFLNPPSPPVSPGIKVSTNRQWTSPPMSPNASPTPSLFSHQTQQAYQAPKNTQLRTFETPPASTSQQQPEPAS